MRYRNTPVLVSVAAVVLAVSVTVLAGPTPQAVRTTFAVKGMHCTGCSDAIKATLERMDGVSQASADYEKGEAVTVHDPDKPTEAAMKEAIEELGYTVTSVASQSSAG